MDNKSAHSGRKLIGAEDMKKKIARAQIPVYKDVTIEEAKNEWLRTAAITNRGGPNVKENKKIAHEAKLAYIKALQKAGLMKK